MRDSARARSTAGSGGLRLWEPEQSRCRGACGGQDGFHRTGWQILKRRQWEAAWGSGRWEGSTKPGILAKLWDMGKNLTLLHSTGMFEILSTTCYKISSALDKIKMLVLVKLEKKDDLSSWDVDIRDSRCIQHADAVSTCPAEVPFSKQQFFTANPLLIHLIILYDVTFSHSLTVLEKDCIFEELWLIFGLVSQLCFLILLLYIDYITITLFLALVTDIKGHTQGFSEASRLPHDHERSLCPGKPQAITDDTQFIYYKCIWCHGVGEVERKITFQP